jgi:hypothetical protein
MKTASLNLLSKNITADVLTSMMAFPSGSLDKKIIFLNSLIAPGVRGYIKVETDNDHNYLIQIQLSGLAEVQVLRSSRQTFVVWMVTDQDITKNIAQINNSTNFLSEKFITSFETVSSFRPTKIFITAEYNGHVQVPDTMVILSTGSF